MEHAGDGDSNCDWYTWYNPQKIGKETGRLGNKRMNIDHQDNRIIKIGQNTEKSPGDLRRFALTQTQVRNYQLTLILKNISKE